MKKLLAALALVLSTLALSPATSFACDGDEPHADKDAAPKTATHATLTVENMSCGDCASKIQKAVKAMDGVYTVNVSFKKARVDVAFDGKATNVAKIQKAIKKLGYPASVAGNA